MSATPEQSRWFLAARELRRDESARGGALCFVWARPSRGEHVTAWDAALTIVADGAADSFGLRRIAAQELEWVTARPSLPGPWWGGFAFDADFPRSAEWATFGAARWVLPGVALIQQGDRRHLVAASRSSEEAAATLGRAVTRDATARGPSGTPVRVANISEDRAGWGALVAGAVRRIAVGRINEASLQKVVAARPIKVALSAAPEPEQVVAALAAMHPGCVTFAVPDQVDRFFAGATPETLVRIEGTRVFADALAGTVPPGAAPSDKELREHAFVVDAIKSALAPLSSAVHVDAAPSLVPLRNLAHLKSNVSAELRTGVRLAEVVEALHPTPAVCGTPAEAARAWIREHEGFDRGWYSGAVGWVSDDAAQLCVALRSALFEGASATLFVGAGLVEGSDADAEWDETARKSSAVMDALGGRP